jgi:hypothetical protein
MLLAANPYIAENAKLPPEATVNSEELYERLGKDLCATAANLVDAIGAELREEELAKKEEDISTSEPLKSEEGSEHNVSGEDGNSFAEGESVESRENTDKSIELSSDDEKAVVDAEDDKDESGEESESAFESEDESEYDEESDEDVLDDDEEDDEFDDDDDDGDEFDDEYEYDSNKDKED